MPKRERPAVGVANTGGVGPTASRTMSTSGGVLEVGCDGEDTGVGTVVRPEVAGNGPGSEAGAPRPVFPICGLFSGGLHRGIWDLFSLGTVCLPWEDAGLSQWACRANFTQIRARGCGPGGVVCSPRRWGAMLGG